MSTLEPPPIDAAKARLMEEMLALRAQGLPPRQRRVGVLFRAFSLAAAVALAVFAEPDRAFSIPLALLFVACYAGVARVAFNVGTGYIVPTQLVFIPMLLLLPTPVVPLLVVLGAAV